MNLDAYLSAHVTRVGSGEPMLLLHGLGHQRAGWDPVLPALAARFDVLALTLPGHSGVPELDVAPTEAALADHVEAVMDRLGVPQAHLAGNSLGGLIALVLGMRGRARSVCALSPGGMEVGWEGAFTRTVLKALQWVAPRLGRVPGVTSTPVGRTLAGSLIFGRPQRMTRGYAEMSMRAVGEATAFRATVEAMTHHLQDVKPIDVPVTIAWGSRDGLLFPRQGRRWVDALGADTDVDLVDLPGLGHTPMPDAPEVVAEVMITAAQRARALG